MTVLIVTLLAFAAAVVFELHGPYKRHSEQGRIVLGLASAAVLMTLVALENKKTLTTPDWLARIGSVSYSIYLGHIIFINLTYMALLKLGLYHSLPEVFVFATAVCVALGVTVLIGLYVELPLVLTLKDRWHVRPQTTISTTVSR